MSKSVFVEGINSGLEYLLLLKNMEEHKSAISQVDLEVTFDVVENDHPHCLGGLNSSNRVNKILPITTHVLQIDLNE